MTNQRMVYVSGALSDVSPDVRQMYLEFYETIGRTVESIGFIAYIPHLNTDPVRHKDVTPAQVDLIDRTAVMSSILVIAVADNPSLGVGIEVEMAYHANKPVVLICHEDKLAQRKISRLIRGNPAVVHEIPYHDTGEALAKLGEYLITFASEREKSILPSILV